MRLPIPNRSAAYFFPALLLVVSCRRHPPPPPAPVAVPVPTVGPVPVPTAPPLEPSSSWQFIRAVGVSDTSILISIDASSHTAASKKVGAPLPPGFAPQTVYMVLNLSDGCLTRTETFPMVDEAASRTLSPDELSGVFDAMNSMMDGDARAPTKPRSAPIVDVPVGPARVLPILNGPIFHEQFASKQKLFAEFDANGDGGSAWSADGTRAMFAADDQMYRSDDGIKFSVIDVNASYGPMITHDGRFGVYRRCSHPCGGGYRLAQVALGHASSPRFVVGPDMHDYAFDTGDKSVVCAREVLGAHQLCIERLDLETGKITRLACEPNHTVITEDVLSISSDASFGALETNDADPSSSHLVVYDLRTGVRQRSIDAWSNVPPVDGQGRVALDDDARTGEARVSDAASIKTVGVGEPLAWDHASRLVVLHRSALTDPSKCGIVSTITP